MQTIKEEPARCLYRLFWVYHHSHWKYIQCIQRRALPSAYFLAWSEILFLLSAASEFGSFGHTTQQVNVPLWSDLWPHPVSYKNSLYCTWSETIKWIQLLVPKNEYKFSHGVMCHMAAFNTIGWTLRLETSYTTGTVCHHVMNMYKKRKALYFLWPL